jgi:hypothetical protein
MLKIEKEIKKDGYTHIRYFEGNCASCNFHPKPGEECPKKSLMKVKLKRDCQKLYEVKICKNWKLLDHIFTNLKAMPNNSTHAHPIKKNPEFPRFIKKSNHQDQ